MAIRVVDRLADQSDFDSDSLLPAGASDGRVVKAVWDGSRYNFLAQPDVKNIFTPTPLTAGVSLSALRVVRLEGGSLQVASSDNPDHIFRLVGFTLSSVGSGSTISPLLEGVVTDDSWSWNASLPIWLGVNGVLTQTPPTTGFLVQVATVITATQIFFQIQEGTLL